MSRGFSGLKKVKEVFRRFSENILSVFKKNNPQEVGKQNRFGLEVIESKTVPAGEAYVVSPNGRILCRIINIAHTKEG